jgi:hypothetical protein
MVINFFFVSIGQIGQIVGEDNCSGNYVEGSSLRSKFMLIWHIISICHNVLLSSFCKVAQLGNTNILSHSNK